LTDRYRRRLFCYGTLQIPVVLEAVIGRRIRGTDAFLPNFAPFQVRQAEYPALVRAPGDCVRGRLYQDVTPPEFAILDRFEGRLYRRRRQVVLMNTGLRVQAWAYMVAPGREKQVTGSPWCLERFMRTEFPRFMQRFVTDRREQYAMHTG
jgi:gamma-glutamylcyclotransferase (GGCT)/AIG2-like uncharacterized protein YtfP